MRSLKKKKITDSESENRRRTSEEEEGEKEKKDMKKSPEAAESVRCTVSGCTCACFKPGSVRPRSCDRCGHSWVPHALAKLQLQAQPLSGCGPVEVALPGLVFDLSSLVLYGAQAVPVRLKILLDRLYSILSPEQVGHILHTLGWSLGDYVRGYMLQHPGGKVLDRWLMVTPEEELLILKQFFRFGETRPIVELMTLQCLAAVNHLSEPELNPAPKSCQSNNISTFRELIGGSPGLFRNTRRDSRLAAGVCRFRKNSPVEHNDSVHNFENILGGPSLLLPFHFSSSAVHSLVPPTKELVAPGKLTQCLQKLSGTKLAGSHRQEVGRREHGNDPIIQQPKDEPSLKIKADPDKPNQARSVWHQDPQFQNDQELDLHRGTAKQENTSSLSPSLNSSLLPSSSSLHLSISSSSSCPLKISHSSSYTFNPLPSFSSSFLCPLSTSTFSSSLHPLPASSSSLRPLPSSLCSLPSLSPTGGRKGRVCCGVCGKSFYDKGTLKIHYNAVHLKIKHRCTVAGCTMVFSSLRSRNRHSANPNPRLHTGASRDAHRNTHTSSESTPIHKDNEMHDTPTRTCVDKDSSDTLWQHDDDDDVVHALVHVHTLRHGLNSHTNPQRHSPPPSPPPPPRTLSQDADQSFTLSDRPNLHLQTPPPPPPPLLPALSAPSMGSPPSLVPPVASMVDKTERRRHLFSFRTDHTPLPGPSAITITTTTASCNTRSRDCDVTEGTQDEARVGPLTDPERRRESGHAAPKKKPRKSNMPVKIKREKVDGGGGEEEEEEC